ncbi:hypothetical protein VNO77_28170 [Canavalia gladiata]|uniref:Uncharacterized protein n=1 Tax=Canavalia gladiata TaxID=3824 RepID=A0AAN9KVB9_CANGL
MPLEPRDSLLVPFGVFIYSFIPHCSLVPCSSQLPLLIFLFSAPFQSTRSAVLVSPSVEKELTFIHWAEVEKADSVLELEMSRLWH